MHKSIHQNLIKAYHRVLLKEAKRKIPDRYESEKTQEYINWLNTLDKKTRSTRILPYVKTFIQRGSGSKKTLNMTRYDDYVEGEELQELRIGKNYRVYFNYIDVNSVVLIYGSHKSKQNEGILKARRIRDDNS